jgi:NTP pyrophosphatase (non-canonical NTP hydrolase)
MNDLDRYQNDACSTAVYPGRNTISGIVYCALKLNGEAGEVAEKVGKALRDDKAAVTPERREALLLELGDVMWYVANLANELQFSLRDVAEANLQKLASRKARGTLQGSGDTR